MSCRTAVILARHIPSPKEDNRAVKKVSGGLCRRKDIKNPRVKNKMRFEKKSKARRGQVQDVREPSAAYGGESTGIKARVSKSRRF